PLTYAWTQLTGPETVHLSAATSIRPAFFAPVTGTYGFRVTVDDGHGGTASATTTVTAGPDAATTTFVVVSEPGDYVGDGRVWSYNTGNAGFVSATRLSDEVQISLTIGGLTYYWFVVLAPISGQQLAVGTYTDARRADFRAAGHPGLDVAGDHRGCNDLSG